MDSKELLRDYIAMFHILVIDTSEKAVPYLDAISFPAQLLKGHVMDIDVFYGGGALDLDDIPFIIADGVQDIRPGINLTRKHTGFEQRPSLL